MEKYKICPDCGRHNNVEKRKCACGADLTLVNATDDETEARAARLKEEDKAPGELTVSDAPSGYVRVCGCGHRNPAWARKCESCGEEIADLAPVPAAGISACLVLDDGSRFPVTDGLVIGRENALSDRLSGYLTVSRRHCMLILRPEGLFVKDLGSTNGTFVNGKRAGNEETPLQNGDSLELSQNPSGAKDEARSSFHILVEIT
ncbi:MAG: FHA domain-containing protein [Abditibacteriota bacterium]|nr:FHA domain-containing protein [Abditibacteriota bacterium]